VGAVDGGGAVSVAGDAVAVAGAAVGGAGAAVAGMVAAGASMGGLGSSVIDAEGVSSGGWGVAAPPLPHAVAANPSTSASPARRGRE
jgi:hypothetical protein